MSDQSNEDRIALLRVLLSDHKGGINVLDPMDLLAIEDELAMLTSDQELENMWAPV